MHILNAYKVTMLKHLHLLNIWHHLQWKFKKKKAFKTKIKYSDMGKNVPCDSQDKVAVKSLSTYLKNKNKIFQSVIV